MNVYFRGPWRIRLQIGSPNKRVVPNRVTQGVPKRVLAPYASLFSQDSGGLRDRGPPCISALNSTLILKVVEQ